jgi:DNA-binding transcriptional ArsR family regulator
MGVKDHGLTDEMAETVAHRFRLLSMPVRLLLVQLLKKEERSVNDLAAQLELNQPVASRHLTALANGGILKRRREGTSIYYSIADPMVFQLCDLVCSSAREQARIQFNALHEHRHSPVKSNRRLGPVIHRRAPR